MSSSLPLTASLANHRRIQVLSEHIVRHGEKHPELNVAKSYAVVSPVSAEIMAVPSITTHVLDTSVGSPAAGMPLMLEMFSDNSWNILVMKHTDDNGKQEIEGLRRYARNLGDVFGYFGAGRATVLKGGTSLAVGLYRLNFNTFKYFQKQQKTCFYPEVSITFEVENKNEHYHVPLLISPYGYSTYRGS